MAVFNIPSTNNTGVKRSKIVASVNKAPSNYGANQPIQYNVGNNGFESAFDRILPKNEVGKNSLYRRIYQYDSVSGAAIDLMALLPFSDLSLTGVEDKAVLRVFQDTMEHLNVRSLIPQIATEYLIIGKVIGTLVFNDGLGIFTDLIAQNPDFCTMEPIPLQGYDPKIDLKVPPEFRKFLTSKDPRDIAAREELPEGLKRKLLSGKVALDPMTTLYLSRKAYPNDMGTSYLSRVVPFYILEQLLLEGTISGAQRRQRAITHIVAGSDDWEPTPQQLEELIEMFVAADLDPVGAIVATKRDVEVNEVKQGGDFWKVTDEWDGLTQAKMRSLGINESFLSGDATYNTMEAALSVFIEMLRSFRLAMTQGIFYVKIFPILARVHRFIRRKQSELDHNIRITGTAKNIPVKDLIMPEIQWHKQLAPSYDESYFSILSSVQEQGLPIPLRIWAAAGGFSIEKLLDGLDDDIEVRKQLSEYREKLKELPGAGGEEEEAGWGGVGNSALKSRRKQRILEVISRGEKAANSEVAHKEATKLLRLAGLKENLPASKILVGGYN